MLEKILVKIVQSYIFTNIIALLIYREFFNLVYVNKVNLFLFIGFLLAFFALSFLASKYIKVNDHFVLLILFTVYFFTANSIAMHFYFSLSTILILMIYLYYLYSNHKIDSCLKRIHQYFKNNKRVRWIILGLTLGSFLFIAILTIYRNISLNSSCFDFGIFSQMFYYMKEKGISFTTCERNTLLSHFNVHVSPIFYLALPIYFIIPSPNVLLVIQALLIVLGVIPLVKLCRMYHLPNILILIFACVYLFHPALMNGAFFDFHENKFYPPLILGLIYFMEKKKLPWIYAFLALTLMVKEDSFIYPLFIGLFYFFVKKNKHGLIISGISILYFGGAFAYLMAFGYSGPMSYRFENFISDHNLGLLSVIKTIALNPLYLFKEIFVQRKLEFILQVLLPLGFLPFMSKKVSYFLLLVPFIIINLMSNYVYQYDIGFQYTYGSIPIVLFLSVINLSEIKNISAKRMITSLMLFSTLFFTATFATGKLYYSRTYHENREKIDLIKRELDQIDEKYSVLSSTYFIPYLSQREEIYLLPDYTKKTDYVVIDLYHDPSDYQKYYYYYIENGYEEVCNRENLIVILKKII